MSSTDVVNEYIAIINKLEELRLLLKDKLIQLKVIDSDDLLAANMTFPKLLTKVNPTDINSIINKQLPDLPIDRTTDFVTNFKINGEYNQQYSIETFNSLLIDKLNFYREYLIYQLKNMGINEYEINQAITIKNLILLLNKIDKIKTIDDIVCDNTIPLIVDEANTLDVTVFDETLVEVEVGTLEIYENGTRIYKGNIGEEIIITPTTIGEHTYSFKYVNVVTENNIERTISKYITSELFSITFDVTYPQLEGLFTLQNVTTTSKYYTGGADDFFGYESDLWDIDVNIFNIHQESINQAIPFSVYMYDENHLVTSGTTDTTGHIKLTNVSIPYTNFNFIDYRESAITTFSNNENILYDNEESEIEQTNNILDELSFIKKPELVNNKILYERVIFNKNNYLDDLNDCVISIELIDGTLQYRTFSTSNHTRIEEIENLTNIIKDFVTEIFYKNDNVTYETLTNKIYEYEKPEIDYSVPLILKTQLSNPQYPNVELYHDINIFYVPLKIDIDNLIWYKGDPNMPSDISIILCDEKTNKPLLYLDQEYILEIYDITTTLYSPIYNYEIDNLPYGNTNLNITLYDNNNTKIASLHKTITILSNFEIPSQTTYYYPNSPNIYYKPKGQTQQEGYEILINNQTYLTNENGLILLKNDDKTIGMHNLTLVTGNELSEEQYFEYEIKPSFQIDILSSTSIQITFYDKDYLQWDNGEIDLPSFVICKNKNDDEIDYTYRQNGYTNDFIKYIIDIPKNSNTIGRNTIYVNVNDYSDNVYFTISKFNTSITISSDKNKTPFNSEITISGVLSNELNEGIANATIKLMEGTTKLAEGTTNNNGAYEIKYTPTQIKTYQLKTVYEGSGLNYETESNNITITARKDDTSLMASLNEIEIDYGDQLYILGYILTEDYIYPIGEKVKLMEGSTQLADGDIISDGDFDIYYTPTEIRTYTNLKVIYEGNEKYSASERALDDFTCYGPVRSITVTKSGNNVMFTLLSKDNNPVSNVLLDDVFIGVSVGSGQYSIAHLTPNTPSNADGQILIGVSNIDEGKAYATKDNITSKTVFWGPWGMSTGDSTW